MNNDYEDTEDDEILVSRSQIKREADALQQLGRELYALPKRQRDLLELDELLLLAFAEADRIKSPDALRRHFQYVGKLLREMDTDAIRVAVTAVASAPTVNQRIQTEMQRTVSTLLTGGRDASEALLAEYSALERQPLNQLIRNAARAEAKREEGAKEPTAVKKLRQYLTAGMKKGRQGG